MANYILWKTKWSFLVAIQAKNKIFDFYNEQIIMELADLTACPGQNRNRYEHIFFPLLHWFTRFIHFHQNVDFFINSSALKIGKMF